MGGLGQTNAKEIGIKPKVSQQRLRGLDPGKGEIVVGECVEGAALVLRKRGQAVGQTPGRCASDAEIVGVRLDDRRRGAVTTERIR